jgi:hypothetical protein
MAPMLVPNTSVNPSDLSPTPPRTTSCFFTLDPQPAVPDSRFAAPQHYRPRCATFRARAQRRHAIAHNRGIFSPPALRITRGRGGAQATRRAVIVAG